MSPYGSKFEYVGDVCVCGVWGGWGVCVYVCVNLKFSYQPSGVSHLLKS